MASAGWRNETGAPSTSSSPPLGRSEPARMSNSSSWPWPLERHDAEHLARVEVERDVVQLGARAERAGRQARLRVGARGPGRDGGRRGRHVLDDLAEHQLDDALLRARGDVDDADRLALAQDGRPVADGGDLDHAVRDEDDRAVAAALAADDLEDALGEVGGQRRGHLVEHQHVGLDREGAGEVDDPERGQRQAPRQARQVEVFEAQLAEPVPERLDRRLGQAQVGAGCRGPG